MQPPIDEAYSPAVVNDDGVREVEEQVVKDQSEGGATVSEDVAYLLTWRFYRTVTSRRILLDFYSTNLHRTTFAKNQASRNQNGIQDGATTNDNTKETEQAGQLQSLGGNGARVARGRIPLG